MLHLKLHYIKHYRETTLNSKEHLDHSKSTIQTIHFLSSQTLSPKHHQGVFDSSHFHTKQ